MKIRKICIEIETNKYMNSHCGTKEITNKFPEVYQWIDYTDSEGNPRNLPEDFDKDQTYYWDSENDQFTDDEGNTYDPMA